MSLVSNASWSVFMEDSWCGTSKFETIYVICVPSRNLISVVLTPNNSKCTWTMCPITLQVRLHFSQLMLMFLKHYKGCYKKWQKKFPTSLTPCQIKNIPLKIAHWEILMCMKEIIISQANTLCYHHLAFLSYWRHFMIFRSFRLFELFWCKSYVLLSCP